MNCSTSGSRVTTSCERESVQFHEAQREAIETLSTSLRSLSANRTSLLETYAKNTLDLRLPQYDEFARYCLKMATGSGKTLVFAMAIVWQFANYIRGNKEYANNFLILAPNIIVFDRLKTDFESGQVFRELPLIPKHLNGFGRWNITCVATRSKRQAKGRFIYQYPAVLRACNESI